MRISSKPSELAMQHRPELVAELAAELGWTVGDVLAELDRQGDIVMSAEARPGEVVVRIEVVK